MNAVTLAREAMRARFEIVLCDDRLTPADLRAAGEEALGEVERAEGWLSVYRPDADLYAVNAGGDAGPVRVDARVLALLARASALSEATGGAFDMTVGPLLALWRGAGEAGRVPHPDEIAATLGRIGMGRVLRRDDDARTAAFAMPGARLDPGAIGKGYALDRAADVLRDAGVTRALLHGGTSTVVALGSAPGRDDGWPVAIQHPHRPDARAATALITDGRTLGVSAVHGKTFWAAADGRRFGHVLDPRTGYPVERTALAAVVAPSAADADALSTALLVRGAGAIPELSARFPDAAGLLTVDADGRTVAVGGAWRDVSA